MKSTSHHRRCRMNPALAGETNHMTIENQNNRHMNRIIYTIVFLSISPFIQSQTIDDLLQSIERNNPKILTLQKWIEGERIKSRTGIYPGNPEATYKYLWGNSSEIGNMQEFEIIQAFRFPGYYNSKADIQQLKFEQKFLLAEKAKKEVMHQVRITFFNLIWLLKVEQVLENRVQEAQKLVKLMQQGFKQGEISKPVYDKARIASINILNELQKVKSEIKIKNDRLLQLNGGNDIIGIEYKYPSDYILPDLDSLLKQLPDRNSELRIAQSIIQENKNRIKFEKRNYLPEFQAGYKSEVLLNQKFKGLHAGITIPLWEDKNKVREAKLKDEWSVINYNQIISEIQTEIIALYNTIQMTYNNYLQMKEILDSEQVTESNLELLRSGQISFSEYLIDIQFLMESQRTYMETEKEYYNLMSELLLKANIDS